MLMKNRLTLLLAFLFLFVPLVSLAGMGGGKLLKPGSVAPDFTFKDLDGKEETLHTYAKGKPVVLVFIQTACGSCQREMSFLKDMKAAGTDVDILVIFIDVREMDFKAYVKEYNLPFRFTWDSNYSTADSYGVSFAPASFLVDKDRNIAKVYRGWSRGVEDISQDVKTLLGK